MIFIVFMGFLLLSLLNSGWICISIYWIVFESSQLLEESEHVLFVIITSFMLFFVYPVMEKGINTWSNLTLFSIMCLFLISSPIWVYLFLEVSLIPIVILILGWGLQPERISATYHLLVYTFVFSSPLLVCVVFMEENSELNNSSLFCFLMCIALMVNLPLFLVHVWLPNAHVEAPTSGSIILAGILLNIGALGFLWVQNYCLGNWNIFFFFCALLGAGISAISCSFQSDVNSFVAYSSIAHINYSFVVICFISSQGDSSSSILLLSHSFISSALLFLAGVCLHLLGTRSLYFFQNVFLLNSFVVIFLFVIISSNFSVPPSIGLFGEASSFIIGFSNIWSLSFFVFLYFFLVSYYSIFLGLSFCGNTGQVSISNSGQSFCFFVGASLFNLVLFSLY